MFYTLGQREGLGIGGRQDSADEPWYVADKNLAENALIVVQGGHPMLYSNALEASAAGWIGQAPASLAKTGELHCNVKIRYRQPDQACHVTQMTDDRLLVSFEAEQRAVAPGQFAVFYDGDRCLGGAVIDKAISRRHAVRAAV
jgi:tRNA-specific 2-thiouridylase